MNRVDRLDAFACHQASGKYHLRRAVPCRWFLPPVSGEPLLRRVIPWRSSLPVMSGRGHVARTRGARSDTWLQRLLRVLSGWGKA
jgi:hypothetical protein